jgi:hypothetical protein
MIERKKREKILPFGTPNAAYVPYYNRWGSSFRGLAVLLVHSACTTLVLALFSFPPTITSQRLTISVKETRNRTSEGLFTVNRSASQASLFGWGGQ